ncbi:sodium-dependent transporter [Endozoicomonas lisbonensis]|uniref:NSS family neurotransmitter:Na+ symporter n=1 Tax=Endozoicomonas lisbonensis TaxID=3120522 RepID=A0ABV2SHH5_9GAMM
MSVPNWEGQVWKSKATFILAASGAAIGLANLWRFPYIASEYGGSAFIIVYLLCVLFLSVPLLIAEVSLGRYSRSNPITAMSYLARHAGVSRAWVSIGVIGVVISLIILSFYSVIGGWAMYYTFESFAGTFAGMSATSVCDHFDNMISSPVTMIIWHSLFILASCVIVGLGIYKGLENGLRLIMPALFLLMLLMLVYAITQTSQFGRAVEFMFKPDFSKLTTDGVVAATGQAFFTLGPGLCMMMTYGSYISKENNVLTSCMSIAALDTLAAILAGLFIFPIVFEFGMEARSGPGLLFVSMTTAISRAAFGDVLGGAIFILVALAALSSAISMLEPAVAWLHERFGISRPVVTGATGCLVWLVGLGSVFSFNIWSGEDYRWFGKTFFNLLVYLTTNLMMPLNGILIAIFAGWKMGRTRMIRSLELPNAQFTLWRFLTSVLAPAVIMVILLVALAPLLKY